ncbi:DUF2550 domain-containing protein [Corynebacterium sp. TAE3-ERU30]|nr:DUF2550 domain-containing protein [Corynebacterium sp. TAE3-ERU30]
MAMEVRVIASVIIAAAGVAALLVLWRFFTLRSQGTPVIMRRLPAEGVHGWRHGMLRYRGMVLYYYKVRSLLPSPNMVFSRSDTQVVSRRRITAGEASFMEPYLSILELDIAGQHYEVALDAHSEMALTAWIEAAPSRQRVRTNLRAARSYFRESQGHQ